MSWLDWNALSRPAPGLGRGDNEEKIGAIERNPPQLTAIECNFRGTFRRLAGPGIARSQAATKAHYAHRYHNRPHKIPEHPNLSSFVAS
jgi:hypothetical protein